jgi:predicted ABC-type ATPase
LTATTDRPTLWIIAGANGSGKSSAYDRMAIEAPAGSIWIINPDILSARIRDHEGMAAREANIEALKRIEAWLKASVRAHQSIGVETVLSTAKYRRLVRLARKHDFEVRMIYVTLKSVELNIERVKLRVAKGGHDVPEQRIRDRRRRSFGELPWFLANLDDVLILDNSAAEPTRIAQKSDNVLELFGEEHPPELEEAIERTLRGDLRSPPRTV